MPPNGGRGSQVPLGNNYIIKTGAGAGGPLLDSIGTMDLKNLINISQKHLQPQYIQHNMAL
ncbi:hypothetical protein NQZ68_028235 [Dissostichus eleginoides]|nr:hypothetical protein NQZ68_028235 [Dissostichus eleginoides]